MPGFNWLYFSLLKWSLFSDSITHGNVLKPKELVLARNN